MGRSWAPTSTSGPIYTWGTIGGRTDFYAWKPIFLDYSYNFAVRNFRHGSFGNVTKIDNTRQVKNSESFFSVAAGMPLAHRGVFLIRATAGMSITGTIPTSFSPTIPTIRAIRSSGQGRGMARNTLDQVPLSPAGVP